MNQSPGINLPDPKAVAEGLGYPAQGVAPGTPSEAASEAASETKEIKENKNLGGIDMNYQSQPGAQVFGQPGQAAGQAAGQVPPTGSYGTPVYEGVPPMSNVIIPKNYGKIINMKVCLPWDEVKDYINTSITLPHNVEWQSIIPQVFFGKLVQEGKTKEEAATICAKLLMLPLHATDANGNILRNPTNPAEVLYYVESANATTPVVAPIVRFKKEIVNKRPGAGAMNIYEMMAGDTAVDIATLKVACARIITSEDLPYREDKVEGTVDVFVNLLGIAIDMMGNYGVERTSFGREVNKWSIQASSKREDQAIILEISRNAFKSR